MRSDWLERRRRKREPQARVASDNGRLNIKLIPLVLGSSVLAALMTQAFTSYRESINRREAARYSALRVASTIEAYYRRAFEPAFMCAFAKRDLGGQWWKDKSFSRDFPAIDSYPADVDWSLLRTESASEALAFPEMVRANAHYLSEWNDKTRAEYICDVTRKYSDLAKVLAWRIRREAGLPKMPLFDNVVKEARADGFPANEFMSEKAD